MSWAISKADRSSGRVKHVALETLLTTVKMTYLLPADNGRSVVKSKATKAIQVWVVVEEVLKEKSLQLCFGHNQGR